MSDNGEKVIKLAIPDSAREPGRECPFAGVAVPVKDRFGNLGVAMQRAECGPNCALFDRKTGKACLDRVLDVFSRVVEVANARAR